MIFIDYSLFRPSKKWKKKAKAQLHQLRLLHIAGNIAQRNRQIDARQYVWTEIKSQIIQATCNKCWFSEATTEVFHFHIEHFRPKKVVEILPSKFACPEERTINETNSYWWLTFNYKNFRICGGIVNSLKGNYFPLRPGSIACNTHFSNINQEQVILLDPTIQADTELLTFDINGTPMPSSDPVANQYEHLRAEVSIKVYGLKDELISAARQRKLNDLNILIEKIDRYNQLSTADSTNRDLIEIICTESSFLIAMTNQTQPFSKMVKQRLKLIPYQWAKDYVHPYLN